MSYFTWDQNLITRMNKKKLASLTVRNDATHAVQLKLHTRMNKSRFEVAVTSYGCNKNRDDERKTNRSPIIAPAVAVRLL